jgi:hypothetical protein
MLKSLKQADIDAIIASCEPAESGSSNDAQADGAQVMAERERVYAIVEQLSREAQEELLALMWTGGPRNGSSFAKNLELAHKTWDENHATHIAEQYARLRNYLGDGLRRLSAEKA